MDEEKATRGDIMCKDFHDNGRFTIFDTYICNLNSATYRDKSSVKVLESREKMKKDKHMKACQAQNKRFVPLVASCGGMLGREFQMTIKHLAIHYVNRHGGPEDCRLSQVLDMIRTRVGISICRATSYCLRGSRITPSMMSRYVPYTDSACLQYFREY